MSKRRPDSELNQDNWDKEDEQIERGDIIKADKEVVAARPILTARRSNAVKTGTGGLFKSFTEFSNFAPSVQSNGLFQFGKTASKPVEISEETSVEILSKPVNVIEKNMEAIKLLNEGFINWIKKHVEEDPYCILSPVFADYEKHLSTIEGKLTLAENTFEANSTTTAKDNGNTNFNKKVPVFGQSLSNFKFDLPKSKDTDTNKQQENHLCSFKFGSTSTLQSSSASTVPSFQFGFANKPTSNLLTTPSAIGSTPFSFKRTEASSDKPALFKSFDGTAVSPDADPKDEDDAEYVPPKPEVKEIKEEGSVFTTRCKLFYKVEDTWKERGLGNLYIKPEQNVDNKFQLLIRANTNLGNILLNVQVTKDMPIRQQKNNLTLMCVPNPPLPCTEEGKAIAWLVRVKTDEAAADLLKEMDKHRGVLE